MPHLPRPRRLLATALLVAGSLSGLTCPLPAAAEEPPPADAPIDSFALAPTGDRPDEPSTRPALTVDAAPGATVHDSVTLWNYGSSQLTFAIYPTDAYNNVDGAFDVLTASEAPEDLGTWIQLAFDHVTVPAGSKVDIPFTLTVPAGARPGDHSGAILASSQVEGSGPDGKAVTLDRRTGTRVYLRVAGPLEPHLTVTAARSTYHGSLDPRKGFLTVRWTVRNVGNVRLGATQAVQVQNLLGRTVESVPAKPIGELLPGNEVSFTQTFHDVAATVRLQARIEVTPEVATVGDVTVEATSRTAGTWAPPWLLLGLALVITATVREVRRRRRRPPTRPTAGRSDPQARDRALVP